MKAKPRILFFMQLPPPVHGVSQINLLILGNPIIQERYSTNLLEIKFSTHYSDIRKISLAKFFRMFILIIKLTGKLIFYRPQVVYFSIMPIGKGFLRDIVFVLILRIFRKKIIYHLHNRGIAQYAKKKLNKVIYRLVFNNSTIVHLSEKLAAEELEPLELENTQIFIVPNTAIDYFPEHKTRKNNEPLKLLFLSNLMPEKGVFQLINCLNKILDTIPEFELHLIGAPTHNFENYYRNLLETMPELRNKIIYHGPLYGSEKCKLLACSDIFVFPSVFSEECMPLVILEAMQFELPVVANNIGSLDTIVIHGENGSLSDPANFDEFGRNLIELLNNKEKRIAMGTNGRLRYLRYFNTETFQIKIEQVISKTIYG